MTEQRRFATLLNLSGAEYPINLDPRLTVISGLSLLNRAKLIDGIAFAICQRHEADSDEADSAEAEVAEGSLADDSLIDMATVPNGPFDLLEGVRLVVAATDLPGASASLANEKDQRQELEQVGITFGERLKEAKARLDEVVAEQKLEAEQLAEAELAEGQRVELELQAPVDEQADSDGDSSDNGDSPDNEYWEQIPSEASSERAERLQLKLLILKPRETAAVEAAALAIEQPSADQLESPDALRSLADRWSNVQERIAAYVPKRMIDPATEALIADLEVAHRQVLDAQDRSESRLRKARHERQLAQARLAQEHLLDQLGFETYAEFVMSSNEPGTDSPVEQSEAPGQLEAERIALVDQITERLGKEPGPTPAEELRSLAEQPQAVGRLRSALLDVGIPLTDVKLSESTLLELAHAWLQEQRGVEQARIAVEAELAELKESPPIADCEDDMVSATDEAEMTEPAMAAEAEESHSDTPAEQESITDSRTELTARCDELRSSEEELRVEVAALEHDQARCQRLLANLRKSAAPPEPANAVSSDDLLEEIDWYLLARLAERRRSDAARGVPLILDDAFSDHAGSGAVRLLQALEPLAGAVQLIVLSDDGDLSRWAAELGAERASVISVAPG